MARARGGDQGAIREVRVGDRERTTVGPLQPRRAGAAWDEVVDPSLHAMRGVWEPPGKDTGQRAGGPRRGGRGPPSQRGLRFPWVSAGAGGRGGYVSFEFRDGSNRIFEGIQFERPWGHSKQLSRDA